MKLKWVIILMAFCCLCFVSCGIADEAEAVRESSQAKDEGVNNNQSSGYAEETEPSSKESSTSSSNATVISNEGLSFISYIADQSHDEDFNDMVFDFSTVFNQDLELLNIQVTPIALGGTDDIIITIVSGNSFILRSIDHRWGTQSIEISATDGTVTVTDNVLVNISPVQDVPIANPETIKTQSATGNIYISSFGFADYDDPVTLGLKSNELPSYEDQASTIEKLMIINDLHSGNTSAIKDIELNIVSQNQVIDTNDLTVPVLTYEFDEGVSANVVLTYKVNDGQDYSDEYELSIQYIPEVEPPFEAAQ